MSKEDVLLFGCYGMRAEGKSYYEKLKAKDLEIGKLRTTLKELKEKINHYETIRGYYEYEEDGYDEYNYDDDLKEEFLELLNMESKD